MQAFLNIDNNTLKATRLLLIILVLRSAHLSLSTVSQSPAHYDLRFKKYTFYPYPNQYFKFIIITMGINDIVNVIRIKFSH